MRSIATVFKILHRVRRYGLRFPVKYYQLRKVYSRFLVFFFFCNSGVVIYSVEVSHLRRSSKNTKTNRLRRPLELNWTGSQNSKEISSAPAKPALNNRANTTRARVVLEREHFFIFSESTWKVIQFKFNRFFQLLKRLPCQ